MIKRFFDTLPYFKRIVCCLILVLVCFTSQAVIAPGGMVNNDTTFIAALGGDTNAISYYDSNTQRYIITVLHHIEIENPIIISRGNYQLKGVDSNVIITRTSNLEQMFIIEANASVIIGYQGSSIGSLTFDGNDTLIGGNCIFENNGILTVYDSVNITHFNGDIAAIFNHQGELFLYGGNLYRNTSPYGGCIYLDSNTRINLKNNITIDAPLFLVDSASIMLQNSFNTDHPVEIALSQYTTCVNVVTTSSAYPHLSDQDVQKFTLSDTTGNLILQLNNNRTSIKIVYDTVRKYIEACGSFYCDVADSTFTESTIYTAKFTDQNGCDSVVSFHITIQDLPIPSITITRNNIPIDNAAVLCSLDTIHCTVTGGSQYQWSTGAKDSTILIPFTGRYSVIVTHENGCSMTISDSITIHISPKITLSGSAVFCEGDSTILTVSGSDSYLWNTGNTAPAIVVRTAGMYSVTATSIDGCMISDTVNVIMGTTPVSIEGTRHFCSDTTTTLTAIGGVQYLWNDGSTLSSLTVGNAGTYTVTITNQFGCSLVASAQVIERASPTPTITETTTICQGNSTILQASGGISYKWSNGSTSSYTSVAEGGEYVVTVTASNGCSAKTSTTVIANPLPVINIIGKTELCIGESTTLYAEPINAKKYEWSSSQTSPFITVSPTHNTTYIVWVTDNNNCRNVSTVEVTVTSLPIANINGNTSFCSGDTTTLTATGGNNFQWNSGENVASIQVSRAGTYMVTVSNSAGCTSTASIQTTLYPLPIPAVTGNSSICEGEYTQLTASGGTSYTWSNGSTNPSIHVTEGNSYTVTVTNQNGCKASLTSQVIQHEIPVISIEGVLTICTGKTTQLTVNSSGSNSYIWSNAATGNSITVSSGGTYTVTATNVHGCTSSASVTVEIKALPIPNIAGNNNVCPGNSTTLTATGGVSYSWSNGSTYNNITVAPMTNTTYSVTASDAYGCTASISKTISINPIPNVIINGNNYFCEGKSTVLSATGGNSYSWSSGESTNTITVNIPGTYTVTASNNLGCTKTVSTTVDKHPVPLLVISGDTSLCQGESTTLTATAGYTYLWSNNTTTPSITVSPTANTSYSVTVYNSYGCFATRDQAITVNSFPTASITGNNTICEGSSSVLTASGGVNYTWNNNRTTPSITIENGGTYTVTVSNANGCTATASITVNEYPIPLPSISGNTTFCDNSTTILTANGASTYSWNTGETSSNITVSVSGTYTVTATNNHLCSATASITVTAQSAPDVSITAESSICLGDTTIITANTSNATTYQWNTGERENFILVAPTTTREYSVTVSNAIGCTASSSTSITVNPVYSIPISDTICQGALYNLHGFNLPPQEAPGLYNYYKELLSSTGCDSIIVLTLQVNPKPVLSSGIVGTQHISVAGAYTYYITPSEYATSYEWSINNPRWTLDASNSNSAILNISTSGPGQLSVVAINNCGLSSPVTLTINSDCAIHDYNLEKFIDIYPNPAQQYIDIQNNSDLFTMSQIEIYDMNGKIKKMVSITENKIRINLENWSSGIYIIKIKDQNGKVLGNSKFVKN